MKKAPTAHSRGCCFSARSCLLASTLQRININGMTQATLYLFSIES